VVQRGSAHARLSGEDEDRVTTIHLLTWNLSKRDAARAVLARHVAWRCERGESFIAAVKECADDPCALRQAVQNLVPGTAGSQVVNVIGNGGMSVLCSEPLARPTEPRDPVGGRMVLRSASFAGTTLAIVNYHGMAPGLAGSPDPTERGGIASEARWRIDEHADQQRVIVLGDFNAGRDESEITSRHCFSFASAPGPSATRSHGRVRQDLRVVSVWTPMGGTYLHRSSTRGAAWCTLDFLAATSGLDVRLARAESALGVDRLTDGTKPTTSDHLPVTAIRDLP
jgi:endonuclease/exonuclease/phosphatase family metal-dependent hydrolase